MMFSPATLRNMSLQPAEAAVARPLARFVQYGDAQEGPPCDADTLQLIDLRYEQYRASLAMQDQFASGDCAGVSA